VHDYHGVEELWVRIKDSPGQWSCIPHHTARPGFDL